MLIAGFPAGSFQANCYVLAAEPGGPCVVIDPGEDAMQRLESLLAEHRCCRSRRSSPTGTWTTPRPRRQLCRAYDMPAYIHPADEYMLDDPLAALSPELRAALAGLPMGELRPDSVIGPVRPAGAGAGRPAADHRSPARPHRGSVVIRLAGDDDRPEILLTGDTLFAGSIGRTDLPGGSLAQELASIHDRILTRPDDAVVLPGHGPSTTVGAERSSNPFLTAGALAQARHAEGSAGQD